MVGISWRKNVFILIYMKGFTMNKSTISASLSAFFFMTVLGMNCGPSPTSTKTRIAITSPVAGQKVAAGDTLLVTWTQSVASPKLSYNYNFGAGWQQFASVIPVDNNSAKAVLPITSYSDSFQIKVEDNGGTFDPGTSDYFPIKYIVVTFPTTGQTFSVGQTVTITWKDTPAKLSSIRITLSTDGGKSGFSTGDILAQSISDLSIKSYSWVIGSEPGAGAPFSYPSSQCILRVSDYITKEFYDVSSTFSVTQ
jgi:hypothetical protein